MAVAWANASVDESPLFISSTPSVTGPTNCHLTGAPSWRTRAARSMNSRSPVKPSPSSGWDAWAIIASWGDSCGNDGIVATSNSAIANAAATGHVAVRQAADADGETVAESVGLRTRRP